MRRVEHQGGESYLEDVLQYLIEQGEVSSKVGFIDFIKQEVSEEIGEKIMTLREMFLQEGLDKGIQKGMQQGLQKGKKEEQAIIAKRMLAQKLDLALIAEITQLSINEIEQLEKAH